MVDNVNGLNALPVGATGNNVPAHIQLLKDDLNGGSIIRRLTGAQIAALGAAEKVAGVVVYNTTTNKHQFYDGAAWVDLDAAAEAYTDAAMPLGAIIAYGGTSAPTGWHLCNGTAHGSAALQSLIGSANTPDLRNKFIVAAGSTYSRGDQGGEATVTLTAAQSGLPAHIHQLGLGIGGAQEYTGGGAGYSWHDSTEVGTQKYSLQNGAANASEAHNNLPPYYALVYIIKTI